MTEREYEVFERFSIIADDLGEILALAIIRHVYGSYWFNWLTEKLYKVGKK